MSITTYQWKNQMDVIRQENVVEQYTEAESREIYDLMLSSSRIIQVTSGGVRVFYKVTKFSNEEILKARRVFPQIDRTEKLDNLLDRIYGQSKTEEEIKQEIINAVYRPIKKEIDGILIDNRNFLADHAAMAKVRTDLNSVIKNLDGLTLNMLNKVLINDSSKFKRNIEFSVYSGLIASVIFGDFKTRTSDRKVVEDVILIAIMYGINDQDLRHRIFANFRKKDTTKHYKIDYILGEVVNVEKSKSNIISEILFVAQKYTEMLGLTENEPIRALIALQDEIYENTAIAIGALYSKYTLREYRNRYKRMEEKYKESLTIAEDKLRVQLMRRMNKDSKIIHKLAEFFLEDTTIKQTFKAGFQRLLNFREFHTALTGIRQNCQNYIERLKQFDGQAYRMLENLTGKAVDVIDTVNSEYSSIINSSDPSTPDEEIWSCISVGNRYRDVDFVLGYAAGNLIKFSERCSHIYRINQKLELRRNFFAISENIRKLKPYIVKNGKNLYNIAKVAEIASRKLKDDPGIRIIRGIPSKNIPVLMDPFKIEEILKTLLENALDAIEAGKHAQNENETQDSRVDYINIIVKHEDEMCRIKIQDSGGGMDSETYDKIFVKREHLDSSKKGESLLSMLDYIDETPGASLNVDIKDGASTTFEIILPVAEGGQVNNLRTDEIISALKERHWNM